MICFFCAKGDSCFLHPEVRHYDKMDTCRNFPEIQVDEMRP